MLLYAFRLSPVSSTDEAIHSDISTRSSYGGYTTQSGVTKI